VLGRLKIGGSEEKLEGKLSIYESDFFMGDIWKLN
jgi:hypothetical protein